MKRNSFCFAFLACALLAHTPALLAGDAGAEADKLEKEKQKVVERLQEIQKVRGAAAKSAQLLSPEQQLEIENLKKTILQTQKDLKELRKNLRQDAEALVFWTKVVNIALIPLLVVLLGLGVFFIKRRRQQVPA